MPSFDVNDLLLQDYTPAVRNLWKLSFPNIAGQQIPAFLAKTANRPSWTFDEWQIDYISQRRFGAAKVTFDPFECTLVESIDAIASKALLTWVNLIQEFTTGLRGYVSMYKKDVTVELLDGLKNSVQKWTLKGAWPQTARLGDMDYTDGTPLEITLTLRYDIPKLEY